MSKLSDLLQRHRNRWRDAENPTHRLSQEELSSELGYGESTYGQWERARSQPQDRRDMVRLIEILQKGNGIETLNEANTLLQAAGYYELAPHEIRQIKPAWLPRGKGESESGEERGSTAEIEPVISHVYQRFPTDIFCEYLEQGREIRILNTWVPNLNNFVDLLIEALYRDASVRILLLYPRSMVAELRNEAIETSPYPVLRESVQQGFDDNCSVLQYVSRHLNERQRKQFQVRVFHSLPSISIYQVDQFCLMGIYFHGHLAVNSPQSEINMRSFFGKRIDAEFNTLWSIGHPIVDWENWRLEVDLLSGKF